MPTKTCFEMLLSVKMHKILLWQKAAQSATIPLGYIFFQNYNELPKVV
jgi:hypothetical protein